ncbi:MAG: UDP-3-O-acylglucosamine N-acyltransferase [Owenweeksia sp. TMED14]|nr:MAG: UDP-3-O-acylglucosamine N-acyltransferase [Owenweeksia sp. TMED14]|tara:strand:- start:328 stop:1269 length:942 start_codon:yes stop_codon:yes gene_type:complete
MDRLTATPIAPVFLSLICEFIGAEIESEKNIEVSSFCTLFPGERGGLSFLANSSYTKLLKKTKASVVIMNHDQECPEGFTGICIRVDESYSTWGILLQKFGEHYPWTHEPIAESAEIHPSAKIAHGVTIGNNCVIGENVILHPNVTIYPNTKIEKNSILHSGVVIGADGFGFAAPNPTETKLRKICHIGHVIINDNVEIGANSCVDRAVVGATVIGSGTKLDNLCQIGHNVQIGVGCVLAGQVGIAGSTKIGNYVQVGGQAGFAGHIEIGDFVKIGAQSGVHKNVGKGKIIMGSPAIDAAVFRRKFAASNMKK